jgi:hypothetical protein
MKFLKYVVLVSSLLSCLLLAGCASTELAAPCHDFGAHCKTVPVNSWNYQS